MILENSKIDAVTNNVKKFYVYNSGSSFTPTLNSDRNIFYFGHVPTAALSFKVELVTRLTFFEVNLLVFGVEQILIVFRIRADFYSQFLSSLYGFVG